MIEKNETVQLIGRALSHYSRRLREMYGKEGITKGNDIVAEDITHMITETDKAIESLGLQEKNYLAPFIRDTRKLLVSAFISYSKALTDSRSNLEKELGLVPQLLNLEKEITEVARLKKEIEASPEK